MRHWWTHTESDSHIEQVSFEQFAELVRHAPPHRFVREVILHHTWSPTAAQYRGRLTWEGIDRYHEQRRSASDIMYHLGLGSDGTIWLLRPLPRTGGHCKGHNKHSIGVVMLGNYDVGHDDPTEILPLAAQVMAALCTRYELRPDDTHFHRDFANKSCPGSAIDRATFRRMVTQAIGDSDREQGREWSFEAWWEGDDLLGRGHATTWTDPVTASGVPADIPGMVACSLPTGRCDRTANSPFPQLPWHTVVRVYYPPTGRIVYCPLIDEGPAWHAEAGTGRPGSAMIDLTPAAKQLLGFEQVNGNDIVKIRILREQIWRTEMAEHMAKHFARAVTNTDG